MNRKVDKLGPQEIEAILKPRTANLNERPPPRYYKPRVPVWFPIFIVMAVWGISMLSLVIANQL